jgi:hypothetical protein
LAKARQRAEEEARIKAEKLARRKQRGAVDVTLREIDELVPQVLKALEARDWPDSVLLRTRGPFGLRSDRAGWIVATKKRDAGEGYSLTHCYLLSNGMFTSLGGREQTAIKVESDAHPWVRISTGEIRDGLRFLLQKYG